MFFCSLSHVQLSVTLWTVHGIPQARILEWVAFPSPGDLPNPGIKPRSPALKADSLPAEPQVKPKNTGMGSLSPLQQIFPTQESNRVSCTDCRRILYQLSYQGSPRILVWVVYPFSRGSSPPRNQTRVSCLAGRFKRSSSVVLYLSHFCGGGVFNEMFS